MGILTPNNKTYKRLMNTCGFQFEILGLEIELPVGDNCSISMARAVCSRTTTCSEGALIFKMKNPKLREMN